MYPCCAVRLCYWVPRAVGICIDVYLINGICDVLSDTGLFAYLFTRTRIIANYRVSVRTYWTSRKYYEFLELDISLNIYTRITF